MQKIALLTDSAADISVDLMKKYNIPTAAYENFESADEALDYLREKGLNKIKNMF